MPPKKEARIELFNLKALATYSQWSYCVWSGESGTGFPCCLLAVVRTRITKQ